MLVGPKTLRYSETRGFSNEGIETTTAVPIITATRSKIDDDEMQYILALLVNHYNQPLHVS